jgi:hypothetical protein
MNDEFYLKNFSHMIDQVFKENPQIPDFRINYPWCTGALGDPFAGIWFVAENPSLRMIEIVTNPDGGPPTAEAQWYASRGDKLFREMLVKHGYKQGSISSLGGWRCYITNVIKQAEYPKDWIEKPEIQRLKAAEIWAPVLNWELQYSKPRLVVIMGGRTESELNHLVKRGLVKLPQTFQITHYAYIGQRAEGHLGPMHPERIKKYDKEFDQVDKVFVTIK